MRLIGITPAGGTVQFEADAQPISVVEGSPFRAGTGGLTGKSATAVAGAATLNKESGVITTEALTTAAGANYTLTLTNSRILANDITVASVQNGTNTTGDPGILSITATAGTLVVRVRNHHASAALNGTLLISFFSFRM